MYRKIACFIALILLPTAALAGEPTKPADAGKKSEKVMSGMSVVGNDEAPKSLVIVPWKSSELGDTLAFSKALDDGRQPVDRDVFTRELTYYQIRAGARVQPGSEAQ